jgi:hypothetical protein
MAQQGAASILINAPQNRPTPPKTQGVDQWLQDAVDLRRAAGSIPKRARSLADDLAELAIFLG